jgi:hypothetical protein
MINLTHIVFILNFVFTIMIYTMRWTKLDPTYICFNFLHMFWFFKINLIYFIFVTEQEQMSRIMGHEQSLGPNDILKFIYCYMIWFFI